MESRLAAPAAAQNRGVLVVTALHAYSAIQMVCSAAKAGCRLYAHRPEVLKPRLRSSALKPAGSLPVSLYWYFAVWKSGCVSVT